MNYKKTVCFFNFHDHVCWLGKGVFPLRKEIFAFCSQYIKPWSILCNWKKWRRRKEKVLNKLQRPDTIYTWRGWKNGISQDIVLKTTKMKTTIQKDRENNKNIFLFFIIRKLKVWGRKELWSKILYRMKKCMQISLVKILYSDFQLFTLIAKEWIYCDKTYKQAKLKKIAVYIKQISLQLRIWEERIQQNLLR